MKTITPLQEQWGFGISIEELLGKKKSTVKELIIACAVILSDMRLIVGNTHEECITRASMFAPEAGEIVERGFLSSSGDFITPDEAGKMAYFARQTVRLCVPLRGEDIF